MKVETLQKLQEVAKSKGKELLIEDFSIKLNSKSIEIESLNEKVLITESKTGDKYTAFAILRNVPISRFIENLNGRIYPRILWERVQRENFAEGTLCLCDHPDGDGSTKDIAGVWHNLKVLSENAVADLYLVGEHGKRMLDVVKAGGSAGMSSVGYGEFMEDRKTVRSESFELERASDWVMKPSQKVYATYEQVGIDFDTNGKITESKIKQESKSYTNKNIGTNMQETNMDNINKLVESVEKLTERQYTNQLNSLVTASKQEDANLFQIKEEMNAILKEAIDYEALNTKVKVELDKVEKQIEVKEAEKLAHTSQLAEANSTLTTTLAQLKEMLVSIKDSLKLDFKEGEGSSLKEAILAKIAEIQTDVDTAILNEADMQDDISTLLEDVENAKSDVEYLQEQVKAFNEDAENMLSDIETFKAERELMLADIATLKEGISKIMPLNEFLDKVIDTNKSKDGAFNVNAPGADKGSLEYVTDESKKEFEGNYAAAYKGLRSEMDSFEKIATSDVTNPPGIESQQKVAIAPATSSGGDGSIVEVQSATGAVVDINSLAHGKQDTTAEYLRHESVKRELDPKKAFPLKEGAKESLNNKKSHLNEFFELQVAKYPFLADHKKEIVASADLKEASMKIDALLEDDTENEVIVPKKSFKENVKDKWLGNRR